MTAKESIGMNGRLLLDTSIVIAVLRGEDAVLRRLASAAYTVYLSAVTLGELYYGALSSARAQQNLAGVAEVEKRSAVLACDAETALEYARVRQFLRSKGKPVPENDIWIAATARQYALTLVSRDRHFTEIEALDLRLW
jgi:tRNA(fMet)-specific endonuclease VapC